MLGVRVVGHLELTLDGEPLQAPSGRPARSLLGWLATHPGRHPRGVVAAALWPDVTDESATGQEELYVALSGDGAVDVGEWGSLALEPGRLVVVPAAYARTLRSGDAGVRLLVIGGTPGEAYVPPQWTGSEEEGR